jgi:hypothetical protein
MKGDEEETEGERLKATRRDQNREFPAARLCVVVPCRYTLMSSTIYANAIKCLFKLKERKATLV